MKGRNVKALIVLPTREFALQTYRVATRLGKISMCLKSFMDLSLACCFIPPCISILLNPDLRGLIQSIQRRNKIKMEKIDVNLETEYTDINYGNLISSLYALYQSALVSIKYCHCPAILAHSS